MVLKRLSDNISGRTRRHRAGGKVQIRARLMNRLGSRAFFLSRRKVTPDSSSDDEDSLINKPSYPSLSAKSPLTAPSASRKRSPASRRNVVIPPPLPKDSSRLPHPSIRVSYFQALQQQQQQRGGRRKTNKTTSFGDEDEDDDHQHMHMDVDVNGPPRVQFRPRVTVVEIPSRDCYDCHEKETLWRSSKEIRFMARRNRREYSHDGGDWRTATEEEDMVDLGNGDYMHPHTYNSLVGDEDELSDEDATMSSRELEAKYETNLKRMVHKRNKRRLPTQNNRLWI